MAAITEVYFKIESLELLINEAKQKCQKGISVTFSINDEANQFGNNVSGFISQTSDERTAKTPKKYVGNGKVVWENGIIIKAEQKIQKSETTTQQPVQQQSDEDLPF